MVKCFRNGFVSLVGAGPGDPDLLTLKGKRLLERADVMIYDHLANSDLLSFAKNAKELISVGKSGSHHTMEQKDINRLLIKKAKQGNFVVRLKGGDPFVFGRGGEEAVELKKAGIPFNIVPGVTAGISAAAYSGIPATDRSCSSVLTLVTGHEDPNKEDSSINWKSLAESHGTLIFYMGVKNLPLISEKLIHYGKSPETAAAVIQSGTLPNQRVVEGTLSNISLKTNRAGIKPPAIIVVGDVVKFRSQLKWYEKLHLFGKKIVVTRSRMQASSLVEKLNHLGAQTFMFPTIRIEPAKDYSLLTQAFKKLSDFDWIIFTSVNAVEYFFSNLYKKGLDSRYLSSCKVCCIGGATAVELKKNGIQADLVPKKFTSEELFKTLKKSDEIKGKNILLPRSEIANEMLPRELKKNGAKIMEVVTYRTLPAEPASDILERLKAGDADVVTFTSSSTAKNYASILRKNTGKIPKDILYASIGPETTKAAIQEGMKIAVEAKEHTIDGLVDALVKKFL